MNYFTQKSGSSQDGSKIELAWNWFVLRNGRRLYRKISRKALSRIESGQFGGKNIIPLTQTNEYLTKAIERGEPFLAGRFGAYEFQYTYIPIIREQLKINIKLSPKIIAGGINCGFYPINNESLNKFSDLMIWTTKQTDFIAQTNLDMLSWYLKNYLPSGSVIAPFRSLDFYRFDHPFTKALKGKRVLVVHPFIDSILHQYAKRERLFSNVDILPDFDLITVKAVQTIAGNRDSRFATWFEALDYMTEECEKLDFDIAIVGCGAYGFPLAARIKNMGKIALHLGGVTQLLFGIWGNRWNAEPTALRYKNEYWVSPAESEKPIGAERIEGGCYW